MTASRCPGAINILPIKPYMPATCHEESAGIVRAARGGGQPAFEPAPPLRYPARRLCPPRWIVMTPP